MKQLHNYNETMRKSQEDYNEKCKVLREKEQRLVSEVDRYWSQEYQVAENKILALEKDKMSLEKIKKLVEKGLEE